MKNFPKSSRRFLALESLETRQHMSASLALSAAQMENVNPKLLPAVTETLAGKQNSLVTNLLLIAILVLFAVVGAQEVIGALR